MNPIFIIDREITFSCKYQDNKNNELFRVTAESLVTDYGMFIPLAADGFGILDYLDFGPGGPKMRYQASQGVLISSDGNIRWLYMKPEWIEEDDISSARIYTKPAMDTRLFANRVVWGSGNRRAFGFTPTVQKLAFLSMEVKESIGDIVKFFENGMPAPKTEWHTFKIDELVAWMKQHRPSRPIPNSWAKTVIETLGGFDPALCKLSTNLDSMLKTSL